MPTDPLSWPAIPLAGWADRQIAALADAAGAQALSALTGAGLLGERAWLNGFHVPGKVSAGGGCRLLAARDGWVALNLARPDDRDLLPALFGDDALDGDNDDAIAAHVAGVESLALVARGREMGLAIAALDEPPPPAPAWQVAVDGRKRPAGTRPPLVVDLSALWAGPLAAHLLWLAGAELVKVESRNRPDSMRDGDPALFARLNQGKASVALDVRDDTDRRRLIALLSRADIVIEAARPRALRQLGIDADRIVRDAPGLVWMTITGHGAEGEAANWVGFGDDCAVAGGLSAAMLRASGRIGFVGDAIADPMTGILAGRLAWERWTSGTGARIILSMSGVVASAIETEQAALDAALKAWADAEGAPFPAAPVRATGMVRPLGADTARWMAPC
ncbi:MAG TPA: CoA transferase [Sphingobium sp.]|nr:CoA transferase [Sphingobium sp.]